MQNRLEIWRDSETAQSPSNPVDGLRIQTKFYMEKWFKYGEIRSPSTEFDGDFAVLDGIGTSLYFKPAFAVRGIIFTCHFCIDPY